MSLTTDLPAFRSDLVGEDPGDECYIDLTPESPREETRMIFCWCPPAPEKKLPGFWLGKHLVTQAQWMALMKEENPSHFKEREQQPVDTVSWEDAGKFAERSRPFMPKDFELWLPTEAQWDHACRTGRQDVEFGIGSGRALNSQMANFDGNHPDGEGGSSFGWLYREKTFPVGCFPPNAWGLHDMHGQLWEWCADWYDAKHENRVRRGGSWIINGWDARASFRGRFEAAARGRVIGLRVAPSSIQKRKEWSEGRAKR